MNGSEATDTTPLNTGSMLDEALAYAARGWPVFPCWPGSKKPITEHGFEDATTDPNIIEKWWTACPDANIAFEPGRVGLCAVDVEHDGEQDWADMLEDNFAVEPVTRIHSTPRGGRHLLFKGSLPGKVKLKWPSGRKLQIDTRGERSYIVLPPSQFEGKNYAVTSDAEPAELPAFFSEFIASRTHAVEVPNDVELDLPANLARARRHVEDCIRREHVSIQGQGGDRTLYELACDISDFGVSQERCAELLGGDWSEACVPPWSTEPDRFRKVIANAYEYQQNKGSGANASRATWDGFDAEAFVPQGGGVPETSAENDNDPIDQRLAAKAKVEFDARRARYRGIKPSEGLKLPKAEFWDTSKTLPRSPVGCRVIIAGQPSSHKTNVALAMALDAIRDHGARVLYAAGEAAHDLLTERIPAQCAARGISVESLDDVLLVSETCPLLMDPNEVEAFIAEHEAFSPDILILDTLSEAITGADENAASAASVAMASMGELRRRFKATVIAVHHLGKDPTKHARGSTVFTASADAILETTFNRDAGLVTVKVEKMRRGKADFKVLWGTEIFDDTQTVVPMTAKAHAEAMAKIAEAKDGPARSLREKVKAALETSGATDYEHSLSRHQLAELMAGDPRLCTPGVHAAKVAKISRWLDNNSRSTARGKNKEKPSPLAGYFELVTWPPHHPSGRSERRWFLPEELGGDLDQ